MARSLNGWPQAGYADLSFGVVPGTSKKVTLRRDVLPLFLAYLADWHTTVMPIDVPGALGPDGWAVRQARTGAGLSNHASGTAVDVRYDVLKADHKRHMTRAQINAVHALLAKYVTSDGRRVFGWGGDWKVGLYCDEMHTELAQDWAAGAGGKAASKADVADVIKRLRIRADGRTAPATPVWTRDLGFHASGADVEYLLGHVRPEGPAQIAAAGRAGVAPVLDSVTWAKIRAAQGRRWRPQLRDEYRRGVIGPKTWRLFTGHA